MTKLIRVPVSLMAEIMRLLSSEYARIAEDPGESIEFSPVFIEELIGQTTWLDEYTYYSSELRRLLEAEDDQNDDPGIAGTA